MARGSRPALAPATDEQPSIAELAEWRAAAHRLLGSLFLYPEAERTSKLSAAAGEFRGDAGGPASFPFAADLLRVIDSLASLSERDAQRLQEEYVGLFRANASGPLCALHESAYLGRGGEDTGRIAAEVGRAYAAAGVTVSPSMTGEPPDHVGLELEFVSILCGQEAEAWEGGLSRRAGDCLRRQEAFLSQHLARWLPRFARRLSQAAAEGSFYRRLAAATRAFVIHDRDLVEGLAEAGFAAGE